MSEFQRSSGTFQPPSTPPQAPFQDVFPMPNRLILDTHGGVDDAQALVMLLANGRPPFAITTVFGNVGLEVATRNILATLAVFGAEIPVHMGAAQPLVQEIIDARNIHGEDGLGGAPRPSSTSEPASRDGVAFLRQAHRDAAQSGELLDLLMIGPLTNLALALRAEPEIAQVLGQLNIMGGSIYGRGNTTPAAEFNIFADPEAASIVFSAGIDTFLVPWEPCTTHLLKGQEVDTLFQTIPDSAEKDFSQSLAKHARTIIAGFGAGDIFRFVDPLAAAVVIDPGLVRKTLRASVDVALAPGLTRGMTVVDPSGRVGTPPVTLLEEADSARVAELYARSVAFTGRQ